jgi:opacity protein-like surface antigen
MAAGPPVAGPTRPPGVNQSRREQKMRKFAVVLFALGSLALMAVPSFAAKGDMAFGVNGGLAVPVGKLAESFDLTTEDSGADMKMGYDFGAYLDYFVTKDIAIGADFGYVANSMNDQEIEGDTYTDLLKAKTMQYGLHGKYFIATGGPVTPYLNLGLSMYNRKVELSDEFQTGMDINVSDVSDNVFGMNFGVGAEYKVTPQVGIAVNGAYHYTFGEFKPDEFDGGGLDDWMYMTFNGALTFHFPMSK